MNHRTITRRIAATAGGLLLVGTLGPVALAGPASAALSGSAYAAHDRGAHTTVEGRLNALNNSGARGHAKIRFQGQRGRVKIRAFKLARNLPHAQHIHFGAEARHECPSVFDDTNGDFRLNVAEGVPAYGPIVKSLTKRGDTSPDSGLAVDRFPTAPKGKFTYDRRITFSENAVRRAIKNGKGVVVIHGVDYNGNGRFDFDSAGPSELDPNLPAEATDPALCGVLR